MRLSVNQTIEGLRAAGETTRLRVLGLLFREELAVFELAHILEQSQPRVSRHLRLLTEAGLAERFPDGAWVFYRLTGRQPWRDWLKGLLEATEGGGLDEADEQRLREVRQAREAEAAAYFARTAPRWDEIRSLYVSEAAVEHAVEHAAGDGRLGRVIDLGTGTGRMLTLLGPRADGCIGIDLSQQMLNIARRHVAEAGLGRVELRHGDILATGLPDGEADRVVVHQVLHYLGDPGAALAEAARLLKPGGRLIVVDFAPHELEQLREQHQHRRLGFSDEEIEAWLAEAGLQLLPAAALAPEREPGLTVKVWAADRAAEHTEQRRAA